MIPTPRENLQLIAHHLQQAMAVLQTATWPSEMHQLTSELWGALWALEQGIDIVLELPVSDPVWC